MGSMDEVHSGDRIAELEVPLSLIAWKEAITSA
jgi:hypothetical protein